MSAPLEHSHDPAAIRARLEALPERSLLRDFVYGAVDGAVTTFAVAAGAQGAGLSDGIVLILGAANLAADGFSMAASNYLGSRAELEELSRARKMEERHVAEAPEGEREEVRQLFAAKGFTGKALARAVALVTADKRLWVDTMLREEWGLSLSPPRPWRSGLATFLAFALAGALPLFPFALRRFFPGLAADPFLWSALATGAAFFGVGALKARFVERRWWSSGLETLALGGAAAALAYAVGALLRGLAS